MPVEDLTKDKLADAGAVPASSSKNASDNLVLFCWLEI